MKKKVIFSILIILLICMISCRTYAANKSIMDLAKEWMTLGKQNAPSISSNGNVANTEFLNIAGALMGLGIWIIIISGAVLGIRFMVAIPERKAELKKGLMIYLIGTVIIIGALTIWKILISILDIY